MGTVKVKPWSDDQGEFVLIDAADLSDSHEIYGAPGVQGGSSLVLEALGRLDHDDGRDWSAGGLPSVKAVSDLVGAKVTRAEINKLAPELKRNN